MPEIIKVSVICPTTPSREHFKSKAIDIFTSQDYPCKELIFIDEAGNIGYKRNRGCELATGQIIIHQDDDDYYAPDWISKSVKFHLQSGADITGLRKLYFYDIINNKSFSYQFPKEWQQYICGATMCYKKSFWETNKFKDCQYGEDHSFSVTKKISFHDYSDGFVAMRHTNNTGGSSTNSFPFIPCETAIIENILGSQLSFYKNLYL